MRNFKNGGVENKCNFMRNKDTILLENAYASIINEAAKKAKPDYLDVDGDGNKKESWKKAEADKAKGNKSKGTSKCSDCGCNPSKPKPGCKCKHKNKKVVKEMHEGEGEDRLSNPKMKKAMAILHQYDRGDISAAEAADMFEDLYNGAPEGPSQDDMYYTKLD